MWYPVPFEPVPVERWPVPVDPWPVPGSPWPVPAEPVPLPVPLPGSPCPAGSIAHRILPGDTFARLAARYNTTVAAIAAANPTANPNNLRVGQVVCIPGRPVWPACPSGNVYRVRPGDLLWQIAARYGVSVAALLTANPGLDPNRLAVGQPICIPVATAPAACPAGTRPYMVAPGDTFAGIARRFGVPVTALLAANPGINPEALRTGQPVCIPFM